MSPATRFDPVTALQAFGRDASEGLLGVAAASSLQRQVTALRFRLTASVTKEGTQTVLFFFETGDGRVGTTFEIDVAVGFSDPSSGPLRALAQSGVSFTRGESPGAFARRLAAAQAQRASLYVLPKPLPGDPVPDPAPGVLVGYTGTVLGATVRAEQAVVAVPASAPDDAPILRLSNGKVVRRADLAGLSEGPAAEGYFGPPAVVRQGPDVPEPPLTTRPMSPIGWVVGVRSTFVPTEGAPIETVWIRSPAPERRRWGARPFPVRLRGSDLYVPLRPRGPGDPESRTLRATFREGEPYELEDVLVFDEAGSTTHPGTAEGVRELAHTLGAWFAGSSSSPSASGGELDFGAAGDDRAGVLLRDLANGVSALAQALPDGAFLHRAEARIASTKEAASVSTTGRLSVSTEGGGLLCVGTVDPPAFLAPWPEAAGIRFSLEPGQQLEANGRIDFGDSPVNRKIFSALKAWADVP